MTHPIMAGAEPYSARGSSEGVLVLHGYTGSPHSMRGLAEAFAAAGFTVELPLLPGHGTAVEDLIPARWADWSGAAEAAYVELASRCAKVLVAGLSMGGTLATWLASRHAEMAGLVAVNPIVEAPASEFVDMLQSMLDGGDQTMPSIGSDIAKPGVTELTYEATPVAPLLSLFDGVSAVQATLGSVRCPALLFSSTNDHVVPVSSGELFVSAVTGPVERVVLERSFHVATLDYDAEEIEQRSVEFAGKAFSG